MIGGENAVENDDLWRIPEIVIRKLVFSGVDVICLDRYLEIRVCGQTCLDRYLEIRICGKTCLDRYLEIRICGQSGLLRACL
jgi:hypothetical protein